MDDEKIEVKYKFCVSNFGLLLVVFVDNLMEVSSIETQKNTYTCTCIDITGRKKSLSL